ncbi:MAG: hypothetical protein U0176_19290 [Bacteroidia bacterium]
MREYPDWLGINNAIPDGYGNYWFWSHCFMDQDNSFWTYYGKFGPDGDTLFERKLPMTGQYDYPWAIVAIPGGRGLLSQYTRVQPWERTRLFFLEADGAISSLDSINAISQNHSHGAPYLTVDATAGVVYITANDFRYGGYAYDIRPRVFVYDFQGNLVRSKNLTTSLGDTFIGYVYRTEEG